MSASWGCPYCRKSFELELPVNSKPYWGEFKSAVASAFPWYFKFIPGFSASAERAGGRIQKIRDEWDCQRGHPGEVEVKYDF